MITGTVNVDREATIHLRIQGPAGQEQIVEAIIDTGFNSWLTLPPSLINVLGLHWLTQGQVTLGDGRTEPCDLYTATVIWDGQPLRVMVDQADTEPLVGMMLMDGYELNVEVLDGGMVTLKRI